MKHLSNALINDNKILVANNKKARYNYDILEIYEAGIILTGTEVKSIRSKKCSIDEGYASFDSKNSHELFLFNVNIQEYSFGNRENHIPKRKRKLLLHLHELIQIKKKVEQKGMSIIPLKIYLTHGIAKVEIAVVKGRKEYDKREYIKSKDIKREQRNE